MQQISNGVHDIPNEVYHASAGISRSGVWEFKRSPYHYWCKYLKPDRTPSYTTPAMKLGELVHALVLEPHCFNDRYIFPAEYEEMPPAARLKDVGRELFEQIKEARKEVQERNDQAKKELHSIAEGKEIITYDVYKEAKTLADAVLKDDVAQALFNGMKVEQSIYFTHELTGLQCKVRPDAWAGGIVTDLKTCKDASYKAFQSAAYSSGYFIQAAMIKAALKSIGIELQKFIFYCVEKVEPYPCVYYTVEDDALIRGENEFNNLMYNIALCKQKDAWESYEPQLLTYPYWAKTGD